MFVRIPNVYCKNLINGSNPSPAQWMLNCVFCVLGRPEEQDDSENSTIYITGLTENATMDEVAEFFKQSGIIRVREQYVTDTFTV